MDINSKIREVKNITRGYFEQTYIDTCTIYIFEQVEDSDGITTTQKKILYENEKCRLCYNNVLYPVWQKLWGDNNNRLVIMISPDIDIPDNSYVEVTHFGEISKWQGAKAHKFGSHQLVVLRDDDRKS